MTRWLRFAGSIRCIDRGEKMRRFLCCILTAVLLFSLTACGETARITGIWEQEMQISILGVEGQSSALSVLRFTFREDGTGTQEQIIGNGSYPNASREFSYRLEENRLTLDYGDGLSEEFSVVLDPSTLKLENNRGKFELTNVQ